MKRISIINGPNLNRLGMRDVLHYGSKTLAELEEEVTAKAETLGITVNFFQSNHEGYIVDFIQKESHSSSGIIINAGALTQTGYSILDALLDAGIPFVEVHISNIYSREDFRSRSIFAPYSKGQIAGLGYHGYLFAVEFIAHITGNQHN